MDSYLFLSLRSSRMLHLLQHMPLLSSNLQHVLSSMANQQQQLLQPQHQSPSQLAQMISQQKKTLQVSFQDCLQHLQMMQPSNQNLTGRWGSQTTKQQLPWPGIVLQTVANTPAIPAVGDVLPVTSAALAVPIANRAVAPAKCNWTEHTSPDGYKYYYNSTTGESKWEKLEELTLYEQQQQKPSVQQPQTLSHPQGLFTANSSDITNAAPNTTSDTASKPALTPSAVAPNFSIFISR